MRDALTPGHPLDNAARAEITTKAFREIARRMAGVPGRKSLIWIASSFPLTYGDDPNRRTDEQAEVDNIQNLLSDANIALYSIDPRGAGTAFSQPKSGNSKGGNSSSDSDEATSTQGGGRGGGKGGGGAARMTALDNSAPSSGLSGVESMQQIAGQSGGKAFINVNDIAEPIREVIDSSDVSYTLGFYVTDKSLDGRKHDLSVKVAKKPETSDAKLSYRKSYIAAAHREHPPMTELVADRLDANRIGVMAASAPAPNRPGIDAVQVRVDLKDLQFEKRVDKWFASFDLALAIESGGEPRVSVSPSSLSLTDDQLKQGLAGGVTIDNTVPAPDKAATLRVVVQDKSSRRGWVSAHSVARKMNSILRTRTDSTPMIKHGWILPLSLATLCLAADDPSIFRVNTQLVEVDVVVDGKHGPAANLTKKDFTILDNGKPQQISVFSVQSSAGRNKTKTPPLPPGVVSNRLTRTGEEPASPTVILWDALNTETSDQAWVRSQVISYLRTMRPRRSRGGIHPGQKFARDSRFHRRPAPLIVAFRRTNAEQSADLSAPDLTDLQGQIATQLGGPGVTPATSAQGAAMALLQTNAQAAASEMTDYALRDQVYITQAALEAIAEHLSGLPGRKKLVWISGSFPAISSSGRSNVNGGTFNEYLDFTPQIKHAIEALNGANVAVYPIDPRGMATGAAHASAEPISGTSHLSPDSKWDGRQRFGPGQLDRYGNRHHEPAGRRDRWTGVLCRSTMRPAR